jgi:hypothetical protein
MTEISFAHGALYCGCILLSATANGRLFTVSFDRIASDASKSHLVVVQLIVMR